MDIESLVVTMLDVIDEAYDTDADEVVFRLIKIRLKKSQKLIEKLNGLKYIKGV